MTKMERDGYIVGCYRRLGELIDLLKAGGRADAEAKPEPREQTLPGFAPDDTKNDAPDGCYWSMPPAGEVAKAALDKPKPREWCNTVKVWEVINKNFACRQFLLEDLIRIPDIQNAILAATRNKVGVASYSKMLSTLVRAGAVMRVGKTGYRCNLPTDELREAVERLSKKRAAAKEVSA